MYSEEKNIKEKLVEVLSLHKAPNVGALGGMGTRITCLCGLIVDGPSLEEHIADKIIEASVMPSKGSKKPSERHIRRSEQVWTVYAKAASEYE